MRNTLYKKLLCLYLGLIGADIFIVVISTIIYSAFNLADAGVNLTVYMLLPLVIIIALSTLFIIMIQKHFLRDFRSIADYSNKIAKGDYSIIGCEENDNNITTIQQIADSINSMGEALQHKDDFESNFIANVSHDFRTPLTSIKGYVSAIKDGTISSEDAERYFDIVLTETNRLEVLVDELLKYNEWMRKSSKLELQSFNIDQHLSLALEGFNEKAKKKNITISTDFNDDSALVLADPNKIMQVINNIMENSIKYSPCDDVISVSTAVVDSIIYVSIHNNGPKIKPEDYDKIYERFYKGDKSRGVDKIGAGLGLTVVKDILNAHGEKIFIPEEENQKGVSFVFTLKKA